MIRLGFTTGTPTKRLQAFGKEDTVPRKVHAVFVVTPASKVHTAYLVRHAEVSGFRIKYVATKSNNPRRPKIIGLSDDILSDAIVILPASLRPSDDDITKLRLAGYAVFDQWKKQDYTNLRDFLPANSADTAMFFIIVGPKCLPLVLQDMPYHGPADDDAVAVIATTHGEAVASMFINMGQHFRKDAQSGRTPSPSSTPTATPFPIVSSRSNTARVLFATTLPPTSMASPTTTRTRQAHMSSCSSKKSAPWYPYLQFPGRTPGSLLLQSPATSSFTMTTRTMTTRSPPPATAPSPPHLPRNASKSSCNLVSPPVV